ncbi:MAG TPA: N-methyl-D-aspartate receptor NMDAR2C subunit [Planctomycetota bacterium]
MRKDLLDLLKARYAEPHRRYHTLEHIEHCLAEFDPALAQDPEAVELAIWFHDAVYDTRRSDNEERSAAWLLELLPEAKRAAELILVTKHHQASTPDEALLVDVDLAILGQSKERFDRYEKQIREEYAWVPGLIFRRKRRKILRGFLERPFIYGTEAFRAKYEAAARANLLRSTS